MESILTTKNSGDQEKKIIQVQLNAPQMKVQMISAKETYLLWGRGTGKTTGAISPRMAHVAEAMPGHLSCILGLNYKHLETNVIPKLKLGLQKCGYVDGVDYVTGTPPKSWPKCLYPIDKWERAMTWRNGTTFQEISVAQPGSANAFDFQSLFCDEFKFFDQKKVEGEIYPTLRGFKDKFEHLPEYLSKFLATDKYADYIKIKWILDKRKLVDDKKVEVIYQLQLHKIELEQYLQTATQQESRKINAVLKQIDARLGLLRQTLVFVSESSAYDNIENLGDAWWEEQKKKGEYEFKVAVKNEDPTQSSDGYYPALKTKHEYIEVYPGCDYDKRLSFIIAMDYQHSVAPLCAVQISKLPWNDMPTLNFINEFHSLFPKGIEDTIDAFCNYYQYHENKTVSYVFDNTAIGKRAAARRLKDIVIERFMHNGWSVIEVYTGQMQDHYERFESIKKRMAEEHPSEYFPIRFNNKRIY
ncbi:hypothetical protein QEG73_21845 [Chitinophagaceae bacterium 26-R-25]|nr:hypothetical protein [Chitinophagaceae bacterium 26-R-25]